MMKVRFRFPQDQIQADVKAFDEDGNPVTISRLEISPYFFKTNAKPPAAFVDVVDGTGKVFDRVSLTLAGSNGRLAANHNLATVKPACLETKKPTPE